MINILSRREANEDAHELAALKAHVESIRSDNAALLELVRLLVEASRHGLTSTGTTIAPVVAQAEVRVTEALLQAGDAGVERGMVGRICSRFGGDPRLAPVVQARLLTGGVATTDAGRLRVCPAFAKAQAEAADKHAASMRANVRTPEQRVADARAEAEHAQVVKHGREVMHFARLLGVTPDAFAAAFIYRPKGWGHSGASVSCFACGARSAAFDAWGELTTLVVPHTEGCDYIAVRAAEAQS